MSYDLAVYTSRPVSVDELSDLVAGGAGLAVETAADLSLTVVRGARRRYSFTVDGPVDVEVEDVPSEVASVVLGARHLYSVLVEGTTESEIPHAVRFARRLARAVDGAVLDQQTDEVWSRSRSRKVQRPTREERVSTVEVRWYCLRQDLTSDAASLFVRAAQELLPEALPRRFGEFEPLQGKLADSGLDGFVEAWRNAALGVFTAGSVPCVGGALSAGPGAEYGDDFWQMSLDFLADPFGRPGWSEALRALFVRLADGLPAFFASAEVTTGHIWSGRSLWSDGQTESAVLPFVPEGWAGLPPRPTWWAWLGDEDYGEHLRSVPGDRFVRTDRGVLYAAADAPVGPGGGLDPLSEHLPADLFSSLAANPHGDYPPPLTPASTIPARLRSARA